MKPDLYFHCIERLEFSNIDDYPATADREAFACRNLVITGKEGTFPVRLFADTAEALEPSAPLPSMPADVRATLLKVCREWVDWTQADPAVARAVAWVEAQAHAQPHAPAQTQSSPAFLATNLGAEAARTVAAREGVTP